MLNPTLSSGISFEQPVEQPSALGAVSSLANFAVDATKPRKVERVPEASLLGEAKRGFYSELERGRSLIEQGNASQGNRIIRSAYRSFTTQWGREEDDVNSAFQDATGISFNVEATGNPVDTTQITGTSDFAFNAELVSRLNPQATPDEVFNIAYSETVKRFETDQRIADHTRREQVQWFEIERDYVDKARNVGDTITAMLFSIESDDIITPEEAKTLRAFYKSQVGAITKPVGIDQARWDKYQEEYIDRLTQIVDTAIGIGSTSGFTSDMNRTMASIVQKAISQDKLPPSLAIKLVPGEQDNYEATFRLLDEFKNADSKWKDNVNFLLTASYSDLVDWVSDFEGKTSFDQLMLDTKPFEDMSDEDKVTYLQSSANMISPKSPPEQVALDLININASFESLAGRAVQPQDFERTFSPAYFSSVKRVYEKNPIIGRQIAEDAVRVVNSQQIAISRALVSEARQLGFDIINGQLIPNENYRTTEFEPGTGADFDAAPVEPNNLAYRKLATKVRKMAQAEKVVTQLKETFLPKEVLETSANGVDELQGSQGEDTISESLSINFEEIEQEYGLPIGYLERTAMIESSGNPSAKNPSSSAGGLFQQIDSNAKQYGVRNRFDPLQSTIGAAKFARDNFRTLKRALGRDPNAAELYLAHQQGGTGAARLLVNQTAKAVDIVGERAVTLNGGTPDMTAGQFANIWISKFTGGRTRPTTRTEAIGSQEVPPVVSMRPRARGEIDTEVPQRATESLVQGDVDLPATEVAQETRMAPTEAPRASPEATERARRVWGALAAETKATLARILGSEEEVIRMLAERELSEEDVTNV